MSKADTLKMLKDELSSKLDADTLKKFENASSKEEALSILEGASFELSDDMLDAVSGGVGFIVDENASFCAANASWLNPHNCCSCAGNVCSDDGYDHCMTGIP
jgi:hypothetical protein